jgi:hypothetical protein
MTKGRRGFNRDALKDADPGDPWPPFAVARLSPVRRLNERGAEVG